MKYFKKTEFVCGTDNVFDKMNTAFLSKLEEARKISNVEFKITSSYRTIEHNRNIGGNPRSAHLKGLAVDISAKTSSDKFEIVSALLKAGFTRIGIGHTFVHCDRDMSKVQHVLWVY